MLVTELLMRGLKEERDAEKDHHKAVKISLAFISLNWKVFMICVKR